MKLERTVLDYPIRAEVSRLDEGWDIAIFGGCCTHIGAVTLAEPDGTADTMERPHHKDSFISRNWARELAEALGAPVCVRCGIHYDNADQGQLAAILAACDDLLRTIKEKL
ncbi:MAG: hypothetical protein ACI4OU_02570 [Candidatus Enterenecus sp.]